MFCENAKLTVQVLKKKPIEYFHFFFSKATKTDLDKILNIFPNCEGKNKVEKHSYHVLQKLMQNWEGLIRSQKIKVRHKSYF